MTEDMLNQYFEKNMMSEDCLTLDIYQPANLGARKPGILIWLHGGGLNMYENFNMKKHLNKKILEEVKWNTVEWNRRRSSATLLLL